MRASTSAERAGNLPAELASFVGRRREVAEIKRLLSVSRLVTLTGVGGAGKTRLSLRVAADVRRAYADGVWYVELAALEDQALLTHTIATALGVHDRRARLQAPVLAEYLQSKQLLLVLDNCEHLRGACAALAETLLRAAPHLRILATSRQPLGLTCEQTYQVPTMPVPDGDLLPPLETLAHYEAVILFADRAAAVHPTFTLTPTNFATVVQVCQQVDGIPLAIELAAARLRHLSLDDILERLQDRYRLLTIGSRTALPRHQTLRGLIDWSMELCSEQERTLWSRLSIFAGGFDLHAAEAVCASDGISGDSVVDLVASLVDKSIVSCEEHEGRVRYRLLETIRQYGQDRLRESGDRHALRARHQRYYGHLVEQAWAQWFGPDQERWLRRLQDEHSNIRIALEYCFTEPGEAEYGLRIAGALWYFWIATGLTSEGRRWLDRGVRLATEPSPSRAQALWVNGYLRIVQEDVASAQSMIAECMRHGRQLNDAHACAWATQLAGMTAMSNGDLVEAHRLLEEALARHTANGDLIGALDDRFYLAAVAALRNDAHEATTVCEEALALCAAHGERWFKSYMLWDLGLVAWQIGDRQRAAAAVRDGLCLAKVFNEQWAIGFCIEMLAWIAEAEGRHHCAARLLGGAETIWQRVGAPLFGMRHLNSRHDQCVELLRDALGKRTFDTELRHGTRLMLDQVIAYALEEQENRRPRAGARSNTPQELTSREAHVANLIAQGLSNKEIAAKLTIAPRTAEGHVEHILCKLGFTSRAQIAAWVVEQRDLRTAPGSGDGFQAADDFRTQHDHGAVARDVHLDQEE
ncbi:LuxR C-terminal-related transcriptional regulator [Nonomuraea sp. NPDC005983]|uniref:ATP-binding protein n=1 Tax=Nonomuraea sp. NPDC005983 TaxID=3155595 RepID=UPI00339F3101